LFPRWKKNVPADGSSCLECLFVTSVKKIEAIIKPFKVEEVRDALDEIGIDGMTLSEVKGVVGLTDRTELKGKESYFDYLPKVKIEVVVTDSRAQEAVDAVLKGSRTGKNGDTKTFVTRIDQAVRIRTEERNELAI
jgi:nitrogen regulatory protein P-II 1